jgi:hypothetical protein
MKLRMHSKREMFFLVPVHYEVVLTEHQQVTEPVCGSDCIKQHATQSQKMCTSLAKQNMSWENWFKRKKANGSVLGPRTLTNDRFWCWHC